MFLKDYRRVVISSERDDMITAIDYMYQKFLKCGYNKEELDAAKSEAPLINRNEILKIEPPTLLPSQILSLSSIATNENRNDSTKNSLILVSTYSCYTSPLKKLVNTLKEDIKKTNRG